MKVIVLCVLTVTVVAVRCEDGGVKEAAVRDMFREMLHIKPPDTKGHGKQLAAPRHMLELYQQYSRRPPADSVTTTIRNILPSTGPSDGKLGKELLFFNVSSVQSEEEVRLAQLQLNRRRLHQRHHHSRRLLAPPYRVRLYQQTPGRRIQLASVPVTMVQRSAWASIDITSALRELMLDPRPSRHLLAVRFESPTGKPIPPAHFLRGVPNMPHAFLVVFTEDSEENEVSEDGGVPSPRPPVHTHALVQKLQQGQHGDLFREEEDNSPPIIPLLDEVMERRVFTRNNTSSTTKLSPTSPTTSKTQFDTIDTSNNLYVAGKQQVRKTRSIIDNQLPDDDDNDVPDTKMPRTLLESVLSTKTDLLNYPDIPVRKPKKGKRGKRKKSKKQKYLPSQDTWQNIYQSPESSPGTCTVRKMTVNFAEIGWGEWIISPDKFDANYCTGYCRFPLTKALKPSNHATLQSLVHALGHNPLVPAPSCVPHQMSAITLLYFDETLNVVLKNYPSMIVDSCACR